MNRVCFLLLLVASILVAIPYPARAAGGARWALLIGIEEYDRSDISRLEFAVKDVNAVAAALAKHAGFRQDHVEVMTSQVKRADDPACPTNTNILVALDRLAERIGPDDTFLLYFSGHGFQKGDRTFLGAINTDPRSAATLGVSAIPVDALQEQIAKIRARQVVFMIDSCRNDPSKGKGDAANVRTEALTKTLTVAAGQPAAGGGPRSSAVLFACKEDQRAFEDPDLGQSVFTYYLLEALAGKGVAANADLTLTDLAEHVQRSVRDWAQRRGKQQEPELLTRGAARLVLAPAAERRATTEPNPVEVVVVGTAGQLQVTSDPPGARVFLDGKDTGKVTPTMVEVDLELDKSRVVEVGLRLSGRKTQVAKVTLERGQRVPVSLALPVDAASPPASSPVRVDVPRIARQPLPGASLTVAGVDLQRVVDQVKASPYWTRLVANRSEEEALNEVQEKLLSLIAKAADARGVQLTLDDRALFEGGTDLTEDVLRLLPEIERARPAGRSRATTEQVGTVDLAAVMEKIKSTPLWKTMTLQFDQDRERYKAEITDRTKVRYLSDAERREVASLKSKAGLSVAARQRLEELEGRSEKIDLEAQSLAAVDKPSTAQQKRIEELSNLRKAAIAELQALTDERSKALLQLEERILDDLQGKIVQLIAQIAEADKFTLVLDERAILRGGVSLTDQVLKRLSRLDSLKPQSPHPANPGFGVVYQSQFTDGDLQKLHQAANLLARTKGLGLVLDAPAVLYGGVDLTQEVKTKVK